MQLILIYFSLENTVYLKKSKNDFCFGKNHLNLHRDIIKDVVVGMDFARGLLPTGPISNDEIQDPDTFVAGQAQRLRPMSRRSPRR
jgi:hypothetical protein